MPSQRVLIVAPHADDEVLGCAGAIQYHVAQGDQVSVIIVSNRVIDHAGDLQYIEVTKKTVHRVAKALGIHQVMYGELPDEQLDSRLIDVIKPIEESVSRISPQIAYIPSEGDTDQDHRAVASACRVACRGLDTVFTYEVPGPSRNFIPNYYLDIEDYIDNKISAMDLYEGEWRPYPHPRSPEGLRIHAQFRGMESNLKFAEAFRLTNHVNRVGERALI